MNVEETKKILDRMRDILLECRELATLAASDDPNIDRDKLDARVRPLVVEYNALREWISSAPPDPSRYQISEGAHFH